MIATDRLILRPVQISDARAITDAVQDARVYRNVARIAPGQTLAMTLAWLATVADKPAPNDRVFAITHDGALIGLTGAHRAHARGAFELGYWLHVDAFGHGFATEAARGLISHLEVDGHRAFTSGYFVDNPASGRVLRKVGFLPCGRGQIDCLGRGERVEHILMARQT